MRTVLQCLMFYAKPRTGKGFVRKNWITRGYGFGLKLGGGAGVEVTPGNPRHSHKNVYKFPLPKTKIFEQKATNALPLGAKKCALPSQKVQYFKRVEQKES